MIRCIAHTIIIAYVLSIFINYEYPPYLASLNLIIGKFVTSLILLALSFSLTRKILSKKKIGDLKKKAVLVTGCDTGFGHNIAKCLDEKGFLVFAGCLLPNGPGARELKKVCSRNIQVFEMDVTKDTHVEQAVELVKTNLGDSKLWAIVNNAGIFRGLSVELAGIDEFQACMDVNAFGMLRVTKAFLPLIRRTKGRVINITSPAGRTGMSYLAPYFVSKHTAVGINDCLRQEMNPWGVKVISIEPEGFKTEMGDVDNFFKSIDHTVSRVNASVRADYGEEFLTNIWRCGKIPYIPENICKVIDDVESAIIAEYPDAIYRPARNKLMQFLMNFFLILPMTWKDSIILFALKNAGFSMNYSVQNASFEK